MVAPIIGLVCLMLLSDAWLPIPQPISSVVATLLIVLARFLPPWILLASALGTIPFIVLPELSWTIRCTLSDFVIIIGVLGWSLRHKAQHVYRDRLLTGLTLGYLGFTAISGFVSAMSGRTGFPEAALEIVKTAVLVLYTWFVAGIWGQIKERPYKAFVFWLVVAVGQALLATSAVVGLRFGYHLPYLYGKRGCGTMVDPNSFAAYMNVSIFLALGLWAVGQTRHGRLLAILSALAGILGLLASASLGGFAGFLAGLVVLSLLWRKEARLRKIQRCFVLILVFMICLVLLVPAGSDLIKLAITRLSFVDDDPGYRLSLWVKALKTFLAHPLFGVGRGVFGQQITGLAKETHNMFLGTAAELGFPGLFLFLVICVRAMTSLQRAGPDRPWRTALLASLCTILVQGMTINLENARVFWILLGVTSAPKNFPDEETPSENSGGAGKDE